MTIPKDKTIYMVSKSPQEQIKQVKIILSSNEIYNKLETKLEKKQEKGNILALVRGGIVDLHIIKAVDHKTGWLGLDDLILDLQLIEMSFKYPN